MTADHSIPAKRMQKPADRCDECRRLESLLRQTESALSDAERQLQQAQKMEALGTLVAGVAHEINNPLNLILYNLPLLQKTWADLLPVLTAHRRDEPGKKFGGLTARSRACGRAPSQRSGSKPPAITHSPGSTRRARTRTRVSSDSSTRSEKSARASEANASNRAAGRLPPTACAWASEVGEIVGNLLEHGVERDARDASAGAARLLSHHGEEQDRANRIVSEAVERGVNYFDVAPQYGAGETQLKMGPALKPYRDKAFVACKTLKRDKAGAARSRERGAGRSA